MKKKSVALALASLAVTAPVAVGASTAQAEPGAHDRAATQGLVAQVRQAIDPFRDVDAAERAGYVPVSGCEESDAGGMGIHYLNVEIAMSGAVDPTRPPILLYAPGANGPELLGAEWWQADVEQERPMLGDEPFNGPMPGHSAEMPPHYDLHVWTHVANPTGVFATWNPNVAC